MNESIQWSKFAGILCYVYVRTHCTYTVHSTHTDAFFAKWNRIDDDTDDKWHKVISTERKIQKKCWPLTMTEVNLMCWLLLNNLMHRNRNVTFVPHKQNEKENTHFFYSIKGSEQLIEYY